MPRLDRLPQLNRNNLLMLPVQVNDTAPFTRPTRPLPACRLAIVTTAGLHRRGDRPFGPGEQTYRVIPSDTPAVDILQSHTSLGFDRVPIMRDLNISFPVDRVRELVARGELGAEASSHYSFMGSAISSASRERPVPRSGGASATKAWRWHSSPPRDPSARTPGGVLARALEAAGIATTSISMVREHTEKTKPPRALFVPFPFGYAMGRPNDPELQHRVLRATLDLLAEPVGPVLHDFPGDAEPGDQPLAPVQASGITATAGAPEDPALETTQMRCYHEQWLAANEGRTAFGLSGIPATRFRGVVRFLQAFAAGEDADLDERPADVPLPNFIRYCADDLKTLYFEGRMAMKPSVSGDEIARWFWAETSAGQLLRRARDRLDASDDPRWKAAAFGVAR